MCADNLLDPGKLKQPGGRPEIYRAEELLELITEPMAASEIVLAAKDELGMPQRRVFELLKELKQAGAIIQPEKRGKYEQK